MAQRSMCIDDTFEAAHMSIMHSSMIARAFGGSPEVEGAEHPFIQSVQRNVQHKVRYNKPDDDRQRERRLSFS